jgi:diguanylate cyclase (GGDEF)-like protein/PAS domain S-box-containing protein
MRFLRPKSFEPDSHPSMSIPGASISDAGARRFTLLRRYCEASAIAAVGLGVLVLLGWEFHVEFLMSVLPSLVTMKANTAVGVALSGVSLWLLLPTESGARRKNFAHLLALLVVVIGVATLSEYFFGVNLRIDELLFSDPLGSLGTSSPGRPAPTTATAFVAIGLALLLLDWKTRRGHRPSQVLSLYPGLIAMMAITGYIYRATVVSRVFLYTKVAVHTAAALFLLSSATFFARPRIGIAGDLTGEGAGSVVARRFLPAIFFVPILLGWICLQGELDGMYGIQLGLALYATVNIAVFAILVWLNTLRLNKEYDQRSRAEIEIRLLNAELEGRVAERTRCLELLSERLSLATAVAKVGVWEWDLATNSVTWDATMFEIYGFPPVVPMPYETWSAAVHPEDLPGVEAMLLKTREEKGQGSAEFRILVGDGSIRNISVIQRAVLDESTNVTRVIGVNMDITERKRAEQALRNSEARMTHSAEHDFLTGLPNRMLLNDRVNRAIALAPRHRKKVAVLFLDLDGFKHINDSLGHSTGDKLLQSIAARLASCVRSTDTVSRQGGDEFVVLLSEVEHEEDPAITARRMLHAVADPHSIDGHDLHVTTSIGVSVYPDDGLNAETLIKNADTAMYQAKENGRQNYRFFKPAMNVRAVERQSIEESLRRALERQEFVLHYQPKINLKSGHITGAEALIRWQHPTRGLLSPAHFIPVAEDCGLILPIGNWVLREACGQARTWLDAGLSLATIAVNISAVEFRNEHFLKNVFAVLKDTRLDPRSLELELTEGVLMKHVESTESVLKALRASGVQLAVDDFGTGYSSLSYLRRFSVDALKIDQSFVRQITTAPRETAIVTAVISMGRSLNLRVVAEGVETAEELTFLQAHLCDEAQGYYFSRPVPPHQFATLLETGIAEAALR